MFLLLFVSWRKVQIIPGKVQMIPKGLLLMVASTIVMEE